MKVLIGPLVCQGCRGTVVYGDAQVTYRDGWKRAHIVCHRGFYEQGGKRHRCPRKAA